MNMTQIKQLVDDAGGVFHAEDQHSPEHFVLDADAIKAFVGLLQPKFGDDVRGEFEKWVKYDEIKFNQLTDFGMDSIKKDAAFYGWQACAHRYEVVIKKLVSECDALADTVNETQQEYHALLAVIEKQREALRTVDSGVPCEVAYDAIDNALALTPENMRLVPLAGKYRKTCYGWRTEYAKIGTLYDDDPDAVTLYTIEVTE